MNNFERSNCFKQRQKTFNYLTNFPKFSEREGKRPVYNSVLTACNFSSALDDYCHFLETSGNTPWSKQNQKIRPKIIQNEFPKTFVMWMHIMSCP